MRLNLTVQARTAAVVEELKNGDPSVVVLRHLQLCAADALRSLARAFDDAAQTESEAAFATYGDDPETPWPECVVASVRRANSCASAARATADALDRAAARDGF